MHPKKNIYISACPSIDTLEGRPRVAHGLAVRQAARRAHTETEALPPMLWPGTCSHENGEQGIHDNDMDSRSEYRGNDGRHGPPRLLPRPNNRNNVVIKQYVFLRSLKHILGSNVIYLFRIFSKVVIAEPEEFVRRHIRCLAGDFLQL